MKNTYVDVRFPSGFDVDRYKDKKILIVGGGPTTKLVNWQNLDFDFIFSCNQYFECDKLKNLKVDIVSLINRILKDTNPKLEKKLDDDKSFIAIEPYHSSMVYTHPNFKRLIEKYEDKCIFFNTGFQNKSGAAPRLAILAASLNPKSIYMVGIDGYGNPTNKTHSFDKNLVGIRDGNSEKSINKAHMDFSVYIHKLCNNLGVELFNLGEVCLENVMSLHSKKNYPLTDKILMETKIS